MEASNVDPNLDSSATKKPRAPSEKMGGIDEDDLATGEVECEKDKVVEQSPKGRFSRFNEEIGSGAYKTVYRGLDNDTGCEIAWNVIKLSRLPQKERKRIADEITLLKTLKHSNIINFINAWINKAREEVIFITEIVTGGSLKRYLKRIKHPRLKVIKTWARDILLGLEYLHGQRPDPIIHRDIKCENIFINSNKGEIRIGDLGLATCLKNSYTSSVLGTPEFMAPEIYEEHYGFGVDIYAFGMVLLEMATLQTPYRECTSTAQIFKKVMNRVKPACLDLILHEELRAFILKCLAEVSERPSATLLLADPFLVIGDDDNQPVQLAANTFLYKELPMSKIVESDDLNSRVAAKSRPTPTSKVKEEIKSTDNWKGEEEKGDLPPIVDPPSGQRLEEVKSEPREAGPEPLEKLDDNSSISSEKRNCLSVVIESDQGDEEKEPLNGVRVEEKQIQPGEVAGGVLYCTCELLSRNSDGNGPLLRVHIEHIGPSKDKRADEDFLLDISGEVQIALSDLRRRLVEKSNLSLEEADRVITTVQRFKESHQAELVQRHTTPLPEVKASQPQRPPALSSVQSQTVPGGIKLMPTPENVREAFAQSYDRFVNSLLWQGLENEESLDQKQRWEKLELEKIHLQQREALLNSRTRTMLSQVSSPKGTGIKTTFPNVQAGGGQPSPNYSNPSQVPRQHQISAQSTLESPPQPKEVLTNNMQASLEASKSLPLGPVESNIGLSYQSHQPSDNKKGYSAQVSRAPSEIMDNSLLGVHLSSKNEERDGVLETIPVGNINFANINGTMSHSGIVNLNSAPALGTNSTDRTPIHTPMTQLTKGDAERMDKEKIKQLKRLDTVFIDKTKIHPWRSDMLRREHPTNEENDVRMIQASLNRLMKEDYVPENGIFGHFTETLVKKFQEGLGLFPDGAVNDSLWKIMKIELEKRLADGRYEDEERKRKEKEILRQKIKEQQNEEAKAALNQLESRIFMELNNPPPADNI